MNAGALLPDHFPQWSYKNFWSSLSVLILTMEELFRVDNTQIVWVLLIIQIVVFSIMFLITKQSKQHSFWKDA